MPAINNLRRRDLIAATLVACLFAIVPVGRAAAATNETAAAAIAPALEVTEGFLVVIPKAGFGKDYLFAASLIPQAMAATSTGLAGKIVRFELFPDGVDMYESTRGLVVTEDLPARRLLANFAIVRQAGEPGIRRPPGRRPARHSPKRSGAQPPIESEPRGTL